MADELGFLMQFAAVPLLMLHRTGMVWYVRRSMFAASGLRDFDPPPDRKTPRREAAAVPQFQVSGPTTSPDWEASREAQVAIKLRPLRYRAIAGLMAAGLYAGLPPLLGLFDERVDQAVWEKLAQVAYVQLVLVAISYFVNRRSFQARDATWTASWPQARMLKIALTKVLAPPWNVLLWLVIAAGAFDAVIGDASPMALQTYRDAQRPAFLAGVALAVLIHLALVVRGWCVHDLGPNPKLLVLRVFGASLRQAGRYLDPLRYVPDH